MNHKDFQWIVDKIDDPKSCLNDPRLWRVRETLIATLSECDIPKSIDSDNDEIIWR